MDSELLKEILSISTDVRYAAIGRRQAVISVSRTDLASPSSGETDRFEELLVNPVLLTLATQRGEIDCGGLRFVLVGYGNFQQLVMPISGGHISVALESAAMPSRYVAEIGNILARRAGSG